jgi:hypothetical protein
VWAREAATFAQKADQHTRPISEKESQKWLTSLQALNQLAAVCPSTHLVSVGAAESDVYDFFILPWATGVDLLIRAAQNRRVEEAEKYLWATVEARPSGGAVEVLERPQGSKNFVVIKKRWVVERTSAWLVANRRLARDYERKVEHSEAFIY